MSIKRNSLLMAVCSGLAIAAAQAGTVTSDGADIVIKTDSGFSARTVDGRYSFDLGGRFMYDFDYADGIYDQGDKDGDGLADNDGASGWEIRRARIGINGTSNHDWHYKLVINMVDSGDAENGGNNALDTAYLKYTGMDFGYVQVGKANTPFNLEELTSSKYISVVERGMYQDFIGGAFGKQQHIVLGGTLADQFTWHVAPFIDTEVQNTNASKRLAYGGRVTWSPVHDTGNVIHLGLAYYDANQGQDGAADTLFRTRFGVHNVDDFDDANTTPQGPSNNFRPRIRADLDSDRVAGMEGAFVSGPFSLQGEYFHREMDVATTTLSPEVTAWYLQGTWTLTGESRKYKWKDGKFDKISPKGENGAWELVAKYENVVVDLDQANGMSDLEAELFTLGLNWWATKNVAVKLNYLMLETDGYDTTNMGLLNGAYAADSFPVGANTDEDGDAVAARVQYVF